MCTVELTSRSPHLSSTLSVKHALIFHLSRSNLVRNFSLSRFCNRGTSYCGFVTEELLTVVFVTSYCGFVTEELLTVVFVISYSGFLTEELLTVVW